jgi:hypothetical protein
LRGFLPLARLPFALRHVTGHVTVSTTPTREEKTSFFPPQLVLGLLYTLRRANGMPPAVTAGSRANALEREKGSSAVCLLVRFQVSSLTPAQTTNTVPPARMRKLRLAGQPSTPRPHPLGREEQSKFCASIQESHQCRVENVLLKTIRARFPPKQRCQGIYVLRAPIIGNEKNIQKSKK